ncbi:MAG: hypothetical protein V4507_10365 [Verrucomicrobiota bacterium]
MNSLFPDPEKDRLRKIEIDRIRNVVLHALGSKADSYQIKVMELDHCPDPACEKIETLIILLGEEKEGTRLQFRFTCRLSELTEEKMSEFLKDLKTI